MEATRDGIRLPMKPTPVRSRSSFEPALVMVHGDFGDGFESWTSASELIGRRYRTIIVDRPGFGESMLTDARYSIASEAESLLGTVVEMGEESFHLAGHSYGGLVALEMAVQDPGSVRSLHLVEPPYLDLLPDHPDVRAMSNRVRSIISNYASAGDEETTAGFFEMIGASHVRDRLRGTDDWERLCAHAARFARNEPAGEYRSRALERLPTNVPVGLYSGGRSHPALRAVSQELAKRKPDARFTDVASAGHAVQMAGEAFVEPLLELVRAADAAWQQRNLAAATDRVRK